jgi:hypothetical protein
VAWRAGAARQRTHARHELVESEGLAEVVVRAEFEPGDPVAQPSRRREHQDARCGAGGRESPADLVAVHLRQVAVQNDDVIVVEARLVEAAAAVESHIYCHALKSQAARDGGSESLLVFDDEHAHGTILPGLTGLGADPAVGSVHRRSSPDCRRSHVGTA